MAFFNLLRVSFMAEFLFVLVFRSPSYADHSSYKINELKLLIGNEGRFKASRLTVIYLHGYLENCDVESVQVIVEAYLKRDDVNIIVLDWGKLADGNYMFDAVVNAKQVKLHFKVYSSDIRYYNSL